MTGGGRSSKKLDIKRTLAQEKGSEKGSDSIVAEAQGTPTIEPPIG